MSDNEKKFKFKWFEKLKNVKHIEIYVCVLFVVVLMLIFLSTSQSSTSKSKSQQTTNNQSTITGYISQLEDDLEEVLSNIGGVSDVKVLISLDTKQFSVDKNEISMDTFPPIKGIIITAKGLNDTARRLKVLRAVEAVIEVTNGNIEILSSE